MGSFNFMSMSENMTLPFFYFLFFNFVNGNLVAFSLTLKLNYSNLNLTNVKG